MIYFAYGSNMSLRRLRRRVPAAEVIGTAALAGHTLRFHKAGRDGSAKCDAFFTGSRRDTIHGVVFRIDAAGKRALDRVEEILRKFRDQQ